MTPPGWTGPGRSGRSCSLCCRWPGPPWRSWLSSRFISYWNSFLWPLVIINDVNNLGTIPLGLQMFFGQQGNQWHLVMAASVISMAPTLLLLVLLQKHLIKGIVTSGLGGR